MSSLRGMVALHDLCWNPLFSCQMICKQYIVLNHVFFQYESNLEIQTCYSIPACLAGLKGGKGWYPSMPCRFPGLHLGGKPRGLARGSPGPHPREKLRGLAWGSPGPHPGGLKAHTWGSPGPHPGGSPGPLPGGYIPACTEGDPPIATAAGSMHPTGIHSCCCVIIVIPNESCSHFLC